MPHISDVRVHATHDLELIAAYAAGDATGADLETASALVAGCAECSALHHDLRAIAASLPTLPAPVRRRDFRLTPEQAAALRPAGWRRFAGLLAGPRFSFAAPLGAGLATLGLAVLLLSGPGLPIGAGGAATSERSLNDQSFTGGTLAPTAAPPAVAPRPETAQPVGPAGPTPADAGAPVASPGGGGEITGGGDAKGDVGSPTPAPNAGAGRSDAPGAPDGLPIVAVAGAVLAGGLALLALRLVARRLA